MSPERWQRVKEIFQTAIDHLPGERSAFLATACGGDEALREEVESLIVAHEKDGSFIDSPVYEGATEILTTDQEFKAGQTMGHYEILSTLGRGGMGVVYAARDTRLGRQVALKVLPSYFSTDLDRLRRFEQEAHAGSALNHPNILTVHEIGQVGVSHFIATELVEGRTLRERIAAGPLPVAEALNVTEQIAAGLFAAHGKGIIHRDIKPENVMLRTDALVKVLDFGLAKLLDQRTPRELTQAFSQTHAGMIIGTIGYMSPEQVRGITADARTDIWSLGVVLYEMLTGRPPFTGLSASDVIVSVLEREAPPLTDYLPGAHTELQRVLQKMLSKNREDRYRTIADLQDDLNGLKTERAQDGSVFGAVEKTVVPKDEVRDHVASDQELLPKKRRASITILILLSTALTLVVLAGLVFGLYKRVGRKTFDRGTAARETLGPKVLKTTQLTSWAALDLGPSFSPDGSAIVYCSDHNGSLEIYLKQLTPGGREIQITADGQQNLEPAWSPDGKLIAYHSKNRGGVWLIPALGGVARQLTEFGSYPAWSPDGSLIAFQSAGIGEGLTAIGSGAATSSTIWVVTSTGGAPKQISYPTKIPGSHGSPAWSPDGKWILFTKYDLSTQPEIWSVSADGSQAKMLVRNGIEPVYAPDGQSIYFIGNPSNLGYGVWQVLVSPDQGVSNSEPLKVFDAGAINVKHLSLAADGKRIAYSALSQTSNLWSIPLTPMAEPARLPAAVTRELNYRTSAPAFSPDGTKVVYSVYRGGGPAGIWVIDANGGNPTQITLENGLGPTWSNDGQRILFSTQREGRVALWSLPVSGGKERQLVDLGPGSNFLRISPDEKQVVFNLTKGGAMNLWLASVAGGAPSQLTFDREGMGFACWSPDAKLIALGLKRGDDNYIGVMSSSGGEVKQLNSDRGVSAPSSFSPDGDKIAFAGARNGVWNVYWISRATKEQRQLTKYSGLNSVVRYPAWSPKGDQIIYEYGTTTANIWMIELK